MISLININVELFAIADSLLLAWNEGFPAVICESDCQTVLLIIKDGVNPEHPYAPLIDNIMNFMNLYWSLSFKHTLSEGNSCVGWLAKHDTSLNGDMVLWDRCPELFSKLIADALGVETL